MISLESCFSALQTVLDAISMPLNIALEVAPFVCDGSASHADDSLAGSSEMHDIPVECGSFSEISVDDCAQADVFFQS